MEQPALCEQEKDCFGGWPMKPDSQTPLRTTTKLSNYRKTHSKLGFLKYDYSNSQKDKKHT